VEAIVSIVDGVLEVLGLVTTTGVDVVEVDAIVAVVELLVLLGTLLVDEGVETVEVGVEADWQSNPTL
jgi:hypothetical protein